MHKEVKIGLATLGALMLALGGVAYWRFARHAESFAAEEPATTENAAAATATERPPAAATVIAAEPLAPEPPNGHYEDSRVAGLPDTRGHDAESGAPPNSYLPDRESAEGSYDASDRGAPPSAKNPSSTKSAAGSLRRISADVRDEELNTAETAPALVPADNGAPQDLSMPADEPAAPEPSDSTNWPAQNSARATAATGPPAYDAVADRRSGQQWPVSRRAPNSDFGQSTGQSAPPDFASLPQQAISQEGTYSVKPNDSFAIISKKVYGTEGFFKALREVNRTKFPRASQLQVGDVVSTPPAQVLLRDYPDLCPKPRRQAAGQPRAFAASSSRQGVGGKRYVVAEGDSLFDIARYELGKASRWAEIYDLNRDTIGEDFDYLKPGTELILPANGQESDSLTRQGGPTLR